MGFRDDREALQAKIRALQHENEELRGRLGSALEKAQAAENAQRQLERDHARFEEAMTRQDPESEAMRRATAASASAWERGQAPGAHKLSEAEERRAKNGLIALVCGGATLGAGAAIWHLTDGHIRSFLVSTGVLAIVVIAVVGYAIYRASRDFTRNW